MAHVFRLMLSRFAALVLLVAALSACTLALPGGSAVSTGDNTSQPSAANQFLPQIPGYISTDAGSIADAIATAGGASSVLSGNLPGAALIAQIDSMIGCYQQVGAVAARVYTQADIASLVQGQLPNVGALAVINEDRIVNNFLACAIPGNAESFSAQSVDQPCSGSGTTIVNNERLHYVFAASTQDLCNIFQAQFP